MSREQLEELSKQTIIEIVQCIFDAPVFREIGITPERIRERLEDSFERQPIFNVSRRLSDVPNVGDEFDAEPR